MICPIIVIASVLKIDDINIPDRPIVVDNIMFKIRFIPAANKAINLISHQRPADSKNKVAIAEIRPEKKYIEKSTTNANENFPSSPIQVEIKS